MKRWMCRIIKNQVVILNDNDMSIAKPVGALRTYLIKYCQEKFILVKRDN